MTDIQQTSTQTSAVQKDHPYTDPNTNYVRLRACWYETYRNPFGLRSDLIRLQCSRCGHFDSAFVRIRCHLCGQRVRRIPRPTRIGRCVARLIHTLFLCVGHPYCCISRSKKAKLRLRLMQWLRRIYHNPRYWQQDGYIWKLADLRETYFATNMR